MSSKIFPFYITVFLGIFLIGCSEENIPTSFVDPELQPFFELFQEEALNRGLVVNLETVRGVLEDVENDASTTGRLLAHCSACLLYTSPSPRDATLSRMPSSA